MTALLLYYIRPCLSREIFGQNAVFVPEEFVEYVEKMRMHF